MEWAFIWPALIEQLQRLSEEANSGRQDEGAGPV